MRIFAQLLNSIKRLSEAFNFNERKENGSQRFPGSQAKKQIHFTEILVDNGCIFTVRFRKLMEDHNMYTQINPEYIVAYYNKPFNVTRLIRILIYENTKRLKLKINPAAFGTS